MIERKLLIQPLFINLTLHPFSKLRDQLYNNTLSAPRTEVSEKRKKHLLISSTFFDVPNIQSLHVITGYIQLVVAGYNRVFNPERMRYIQIAGHLSAHVSSKPWLFGLFLDFEKAVVLNNALQKLHVGEISSLI